MVKPGSFIVTSSGTFGVVTKKPFISGKMPDSWRTWYHIEFLFMGRKDNTGWLRRDWFRLATKEEIAKCCLALY